jgi:hypothetical protein
VGGQDEARADERLADRRLLGALAAAVVAGDGRVVGHDLEVAVDELVLDVVEHVPADACEALVGVDEDVHGALGVPARGLDADAGDDLLLRHDVEVEEAQRAGVVQPVDEVLHVGRRILLPHEAGDGVLQLAAVDDHRGRVHREVVVVAGVVDVQVRVQDVAHVVHPHPVALELPLHPLPVAPPALHAQVAHDRRVAEARVDDHRRLAARDEEPERRDLLPAAGVLSQHEEARVQLDVAQVEHLDLEAHVVSLRARTAPSLRRAAAGRHRTFG